MLIPRAFAMPSTLAGRERRISAMRGTDAPPDDLLYTRVVPVQGLLRLLRLLPERLLPERPANYATGERREWDGADAEYLQGPEHEISKHRTKAQGGP
jgi:hypothetical protein